MIIILHENKEWIKPFADALKSINAKFKFWYLPELDIDFSKAPMDAIYYNRMSASSHTRGHRYDPEITIGILEWLKRHGQIIINGPRALDLEISKLRQYQELEKFNIRTPITFASTKTESLLANANKLGFPLISKHNRAGKGIGVYKFNNYQELDNFYNSPDFEGSVDGINLIQSYIDAPEHFITRMEFIGGKFFYAVKIDTSGGFELCPADNCEIDTNCPTSDIKKFEIINNFNLPNIQNYEDFMKANDINISGIEFIMDKEGNTWTYDVNVNTNYNSSAEQKAKKYAYVKIANYLYQLSKKIIPTI